MDIIRIPNINNYKLELINNELILTPIKIYITENELLRTNITYSTINNCMIKITDDNIINIPYNYPYIRCLIDIYIDLYQHLLYYKIQLLIYH